MFLHGEPKLHTVKGAGHYIANYSKHNNLFGNKHWRVVDRIKHCEKWLPLK